MCVTSNSAKLELSTTFRFRVMERVTDGRTDGRTNMSSC